MGYYLANVETRFIDNPNNTVDLIFDIRLGNKSKISSIEFAGDKNLKTEYLEMLLYLKKINFGNLLQIINM